MPTCMCTSTWSGLQFSSHDSSPPASPPGILKDLFIRSSWILITVTFQWLVPGSQLLRRQWENVNRSLLFHRSQVNRTYYLHWCSTVNCILKSVQHFPSRTPLQKLHKSTDAMVHYQFLLSLRFLSLGVARGNAGSERTTEKALAFASPQRYQVTCKW